MEAKAKRGDPITEAHTNTRCDTDVTNNARSHRYHLHLHRINEVKEMIIDQGLLNTMLLVHYYDERQ
jgi:hypothetical protein